MTTDTRIALLITLQMSFAMSLFFSGFFTFLAFGPSLAWLSAWGRGFLTGWPLGFLLASLIARPARTLALRLSGVPRRG